MLKKIAYRKEICLVIILKLVAIFIIAQLFFSPTMPKEALNTHFMSMNYRQNI